MNEEVAHVKNGIKNGIQYFKSALSIYEELGMPFLTAREKHEVAYWYMKCLYKPSTVQKLSSEALATFQQLGKRKATLASMELMVHAAIKYRKFEDAAKIAFSAVTYFRGQQDAEKE